MFGGKKNYSNKLLNLCIAGPKAQCIMGWSPEPTGHGVLLKFDIEICIFLMPINVIHLKNKTNGKQIYKQASKLNWIKKKQAN